MIYIAHRGNINGRIPEKENHPDYIDKSILEGFEVEIDLWFINNKFILGHDEPQYEIKFSLLCNPYIWVHAKDIDAFEIVVNRELKGFWHTNEDFVLTTWKHVWTYPGKTLIDGAIAVLPETVSNYSVRDLKRCSAICSDEVQKFKELLK